MINKYKPSDFLNVVYNGATPPNSDLTLQLKTTYAKEGLAKGVWEVDDKFINGNGVVMGGFLASAADTMMAYAIITKLNENQLFASIDLHTTFHRPVFTGQVEVLARVERLGKKVAYLVAELYQNEKKVMDAVSSVMILEESE
jgi:uncharacterized protein (TIGR00369 family)